MIDKNYLNSFIDKLSAVQDDISLLEYKRNNILTDLVSDENISIKDKFRIWSNSSTGKLSLDGVYKFRKMCPITAEYLLERYDFDSYSNINILERLCDEEFYLYCMSDVEYNESCDKNGNRYWDGIEKIDMCHVEKMAEEIMKQNVKSFHYK